MNSPVHTMIRGMKPGVSNGVARGISRGVVPGVAKGVARDIARRVARGLSLALAFTSKLEKLCKEVPINAAFRLNNQWRINWKSLSRTLSDERGDVPGWVLVVLMTTGLVTGIWTLAAPEIEQILRTSLSSMNGIR